MQIVGEKIWKFELWFSEDEIKRVWVVAYKTYTIFLNASEVHPNSFRFSTRSSYIFSLNKGALPNNVS
jgi:hypothetical protein